ncbi:2-oxo-4-hydroxy-4-carboxy-5-ureidoimidazoline decarboxylase [Corynebacterium pacaense]|uniref:2-oxo-4-hydroxy-4-carboxy-5-ureidoimidazoline decarboxylase n=1 Tax=Corynebacterium pacaense TaxID=1816684 RepID=UPI0015C46BBD|nr:2-oxo-4-hydroxy-4-carboxy-5-ureidoimidazoline decarboxylase [Corynebacterium pacaense]
MTDAIPRPPTGYSLDEFNSADPVKLIPELAELFGSPELGAAVAGQRPFDHVEEVCACASSALSAMSDELVLAAVDSHPPIGGAVTAGSRSESEQSTATASGSEGERSAMADIIALNDKYSDTFGHVFLIRAAGLSATGILTALRARLENSPDRELEVTRRELAGINELRLRSLIRQKDGK